MQQSHRKPLTLTKWEWEERTGLDIKRAIDPSDKDYIDVVPGPLVEALFQAFEQLGLTMMEASCEAIDVMRRDQLPFMQEFEFKSDRGPFFQKLDELEVVCCPSEDGVDVWLEIDRKVRGLGSLVAEMMGQDKSHVYFSFGDDDVPYLTDRIYDLIEAQLESIHTW